METRMQNTTVTPLSTILEHPLAEMLPELPVLPRRQREETPTAVVYCEANFGAVDGKTANGLVRHSELYEIVSVIDSKKAGLDSGIVLGDRPNGIPICRDLDDALARAGGVPDFFILGNSAVERDVIDA